MDKKEIIQVWDLINKGEFSLAERNISLLINNYPNIYSYQNILAIIYANQKKFHQSIVVLEKIIKLSPDFIDAYINLGNIYFNLGRLEKSVNCFKRATAIHPNHKIALFNLARSLNKQNKFDRAAKIYEKLITKEPNNIDFLNNYSSNQIKIGQINTADKILKKILKLDSKNTSALINLGIIQKDRGNYKRAENYFKKAIKIRSNLSVAFYNLGVVQEKNEELFKAIDSFIKAIKVKPDYSEAYYNLGCVYEKIGLKKDAVFNFKKSLQYNPNYLKASHNLARVQLATDDFKNGWAGHELRKGGTKKNYKLLGIGNQQTWDGKKFEDRLIIHGEQGIGDEILYSSMFCDLLNYQKNLLITTDDRLIPIMQRSFPKIKFISRYSNFTVNEYSKHLFAGSLGKIFRNNIDDFKNNKTPWLKSCPKKTNQLQKKLSHLTKIKIGISWKSFGIKGKERSMSLRQITSIFPKEKFEFINLQYGAISEESKILGRQTGKKLIHFSDIDYKNDIEGLAALIFNCDLIVSISNLTAHLAGALGKRAWVLVPTDSQWFWHFNRKQSLWYSSVKLFKQKYGTRWDDVLKILKDKINSQII